MLERNGYEVIEAADGNDAVKKFAESANKIDLVLLDVVMPGKNGQVAFEEMKRIQPAIKALFISGYTKDIIGSKGFLAEDINFIAKPVKPDQLIARVQEALKS
ncbi:response regulator [Geobacter sulfurreducens]|uniref:response regulator n=1 Tax=Geobacter sulfurreducens TaxID=35554 RepID=UPI0020B84D12|nr:response regulator [Geobacter sulfurreducens]